MSDLNSLPSGLLLDKVLTSDTQSQAAYELHEILSALELSPTMHHFSVLAHDLSRLARKTPPWTKKYIHSVYHEHIEASPLLIKAINTLAQMTDGMPSGVAGSVYIKVLAQPGIPEGILIPTNAKIIKCARPGCPIWFVKVHPRQIYHDQSCR